MVIISIVKFQKLMHFKKNSTIQFWSILAFFFFCLKMCTNLREFFNSLFLKLENTTFALEAAFFAYKVDHLKLL